jgi:D-aspartate ligase
MLANSAVVVGLCAHGLTLVRALRGLGIRVIALEANASLPGVSTNAAEVRIVGDINGPGLVDTLVSLAPEFSQSGVPVLFLTNDTMVETVAVHLNRLSPLYRISWERCGDTLLRLLKKAGTGERCREAGLMYPRSRLVRDARDMGALKSGLSFPILFKPDRPISAYKTHVVDNATQLETAWLTIRLALPSIAQEFVPGGESAIHFAALFLQNGKVVARFEGRKLRSRPMGHTTIAISEANDVTHAIARRFFDGLALSGPASLEMKLDDKGNFLVIEPTVGRTDFWVGLCIADGINFPMIEYRVESKRPQGIVTQSGRTLWINGERDPAALFWLILKYPNYVLNMRLVGVFLDVGDMRPWMRWALSFVKLLPVRAINRCRRLMRYVLGT